MICYRCDWPMQAVEKEYHHWCWGCGHVEFFTPLYHVPDEKKCVGCGAVIKLEKIENARIRCPECRNRYMSKKRARKVRHEKQNAL